MTAEEPTKRLTLTMSLELYKRMLYLQEKYSDRYRSINAFGVDAIGSFVTNFEQGTQFPEETLMGLLERPEVIRKLRIMFNKLEE